MDNQQNDISLLQFLGVAKKSLKRALVYILICVIIAGAVLLTVRSFTGYSVSSSKITFTEANEQTLSTLNYKKANAVNKALVNFKDGSLTNSDKIARNLSISAVIPENVKADDTSFIPTSFILELNNDSSLGYTKAEFVTLLDGISKELLNTFALNEMPVNLTTYDVAKQLLTIEYYQVANDLYTQTNATIDTLQTALKSKADAGEFLYEDKSINQILANLANEIKNLDDLKIAIVSQKIEKTNGSLGKYLENKIAPIQRDVDERIAISAATLKALEDYKAALSSVNPGTGTGNTYVFNTTEYLQLANAYTNAETKLADAQKKLQAVTFYQSLYTNSTVIATEETKQAMADKLTAINTKINELLAEYKTIAKAYNDTIYLSTKAIVSVNAYASTYNIISFSTILIVLIAVALIAFIVAFCQTYGILKKRGYFNGTYVEPVKTKTSKVSKKTETAENAEQK